MLLRGTIYYQVQNGKNMEHGIPWGTLGGASVRAEAEGGRLGQRLVAVLRPENALLSSNSEAIGVVRSGLELVLV